MAKKQNADGALKARVLCDCAFGKANDVVEVSAADAEANANCLDTNPDAVSYAESIRG